MPSNQAEESIVPSNTVIPTTKPTIEPTVAPTIEPTVAPTKEPIVTNVTLVSVGDNLIHTQVIKSGLKNKTYNFDHLYANVAEVIRDHDIKVINQETVLGGASLGYSGYPRFNSPTEIGDAVVDAGFNVVLHATNHSMDKGEVGLQNSLDYWKTKEEITVIGANDTEEEYKEVKIMEINDIRIAQIGRAHV